MAKKKRRKRKKSKKSKFKEELKHIDSEVWKGVWSVILITTSVLSILGFFGKAGSFGRGINNFFSILFGWGMYIVPFVLMGVAVAFILSLHKNTPKNILFSAFLFLISVLGFFALSSFSVTDLAIERGGYLGYGFVWPLAQFLGSVGGGVVLFAFILISIILGFHIRLDEIFHGFLEKRRIKKSALDIKISGRKNKKDKKKDKSEDEEESEEKEEQSEEDDSSLEVKDYNKNKDDNKDSSKKDEFVGSTRDDYANFELPDTDLLEKETGKPTSGDIIANANIIKRTFQNFNIDVEMGEVNVGPTVTQYTLKPAEGVKLSKITSLGRDLSLALAAHPLRIEAPIPGRSLVGIEIPNKATTWVRLRDLIDDPRFSGGKSNMQLALGRDVKGAPVYADLSKMPHLLVAGATGAGKTIALNAIIMSMLYKNPPHTLRMILIDPKRVEFSVYANIPHLLSPIVVDNGKAVNALKWAVQEMERRFEVLSDVKARDIHSYNKNKKVIKEGEQLPFIAIVIDELADLMSSKGKEVETLIVRIAQMARAVGIHLILATQRPSVEVITGLIKANITARMAFQVASQVDSRTVLDMSGAEKLLGKGDMLFLSPERSQPVRVQGAFVSEEEVSRVVQHLLEQKKKLVAENEEKEIEMEDFDSKSVSPIDQTIDFDSISEAEEEDELYEDAMKLVVEAGKGSASYLQRKLRIGYARAASILDMLEDNGVVGPAEGSKPRDVYLTESDLAGQGIIEQGEEYVEEEDEDE
ncbi:MAG: DNA translocase FtsK 4TM domain-containing protein [Candidatus Spechtbacterales bacterium]|nr:DNA translocase FtsK 4TM domain-containing protein [Candidatus Spechtbacterales bacterium]